MFLFLRLVMAHFIGDFVLQPDEVYEVKKESLKGVVIHSIIVFIVLVVLSIPYLHHTATWMVILCAAIIHILQDEIKLRYVTSLRSAFIAFIIDQLVHIGCLVPVLFFNFAYSVPSGSSKLILLYNNTSLVVFVIGYIVSIFMGAYLWESFKISYLEAPILSESFQIKYGMFERLVITTSFLRLPYLLFMIVPFIFRIMVKRVGFSKEFAFNVAYASVIGLILGQFLPII